MELAGYTYRVATMLEVFEDCSAGKYRRNVVKTTKLTKRTHHHSESEQVSEIDLVLFFKIRRYHKIRCRYLIK